MAAISKPKLTLTTVTHLPGTNEPIIPGLGEPHVSKAAVAYSRQHDRAPLVVPYKYPLARQQSRFFPRRCTTCGDVLTQYEMCPWFEIRMKLNDSAYDLKKKKEEEEQALEEEREEWRQAKLAEDLRRMQEMREMEDEIPCPRSALNDGSP